MAGKFKKIILLSGKLGKFFFVEKVLGILTRLVDVLMIYYIWTDQVNGVVKAFIVGTPINFALCSAIICINEAFKKKGYDMTGLGDLKKMTHNKYDSHQYARRFVSWVLKKQTTIFLIGSWFYLDPDYVTLLLHDEKKSIYKSLIKITLPSVIYAMIIWTFIYQAAFRGYEWAKWLAY